MPIEFYCPECDTFLRTPDAKAGLSAKCPACQQQIWVPHESEVADENPFEYEGEPVTSLRRDLPSEQTVPVVETVDDSYDFFQEDIICSYCGSVNSGNPIRCKGCNEIFASTVDEEITQVDLGDIFQVSWKIYSRNLGICILAVLIDFLLTIAALAVVLVPTIMVMVSLEGNPDLAGPACTMVLLLSLGVCVSVLWIGHFRFFLALVRGERPMINLMFQTGPLIGKMVVSSFMFSILVVIGLMTCVIPGFIMLALFWPFGRVLVERECSGLESLSHSYKMCKKNFGVSIGILTIAFIIQVVANAFILGILFSVPFIAVLLTVTYLHFSGEFVTGEAKQYRNETSH